MGLEMVSVPLGYGVQIPDNMLIIDDKFITPGSALGELSGSRASTVTHPPRLTRFPVQDILDKKRQRHDKLCSAREPIVLLPKLTGMRFKWLEDIPAEIRCMVYSNLFSDATFRVHNHSSNAYFAWGWKLSRRAIFSTSKQVYDEALTACLWTALFDLRPCDQMSSCNLIAFLCSKPHLLAQMTRVLCNGAGGPQLVNFTRSQLTGSTNFPAMREINISYNMGSVGEILTLSGVKQALQPFYRKHLFNQIKDLLRLFPTTTIRICALRKKQKDRIDQLPLEKEQCEMLCFQGKQCVVKVPVLAKGDRTELMDQLKVLDMAELDVVFDPAGDTECEPFVMELDTVKDT